MTASSSLTRWARRRRRVAAWSVLVSAPINAVGVTALVAMYVGFAIGERSTAMALGRTNDILGLIGTALMMPMVVEVHALTGPGRPAIRTGLAIVGLGAMAAVVVLAWMLVTERLTFEQQIGPVMVGYLGIAVWFIGGGILASRSGAMPHGGRLGAIAALYFGQPWWAYRWGTRLLASVTAAEPAPDALPGAPTSASPPAGSAR
jgi:hypothetical protein